MIKNKKIAVDIVLLLSPEIVEKCIFVNSQLDNSDYVSFTDGYNPHITLGMGCISVNDLEFLKNKIQNISQNTKQPKLTISGFRGEDFYSFKISRNQEIKDLHYSIMKVLEKFSTYGDVTPDMFYESEKVSNDPKLVAWVSNFNTEHAKDKYDPHISLGKGDRVPVDFPIPIEFIAPQIGLFHLGSHGTCKEKLAEFDLK